MVTPGLLLEVLLPVLALVGCSLSRCSIDWTGKENKETKTQNDAWSVGMYAHFRRRRPGRRAGWLAGSLLCRLPSARPGFVSQIWARRCPPIGIFSFKLPLYIHLLLRSTPPQLCKIIQLSPHFSVGTLERRLTPTR